MVSSYQNEGLIARHEPSSNARKAVRRGQPFSVSHHLPNCDELPMTLWHLDVAGRDRQRRIDRECGNERPICRRQLQSESISRTGFARVDHIQSESQVADAVHDA